MLTAALQAFRTPDLRKKLLFTLFIIAVFRLGCSLPTPGISEKAISACLNVVNNSGNTNLFQLVNLFSGGALLNRFTSWNRKVRRARPRSPSTPGTSRSGWRSCSPPASSR